MNELEREEFKKRIEALSAEEKDEVVRTLSNEILVGELNRRLADMTDKIGKIVEVIR